MFVVLSTGFAYCIWNRADYLIRPTGCLLILIKTGNSVGQRRYENSCVKLAFTARRWRRQIIFVCFQAKIVRHVHPGMDC